jgi:TrmH family RNA methyltransferase
MAGRHRSGLYAIEGTRLVERALRAGAPLESVLIAERLAADAAPRAAALRDDLAAAGCPLVVAADSLLDDLTAGRDLGPIIGLVRLPSAITLAEVLAKAMTADIQTTNDERRTPSEMRSPFLSFSPSPLPPRSPASPLFLAATDIRDPGNAGALTRTAHAAGAGALLVTGQADPFHPRATRISRGSIFKLPVVAYETGAALLDDLRRCGVVAVAATAEDGVPLPEAVWPDQPAAILMGNEGEGLPPEILSAVDMRVTIPMAAGVDSYSVNAAAAIILYAAQLSHRR